MFEKLDLALEARKILEDCQSHREGIKILAKSQCTNDAIRLLIAYMPLRQSIDWCFATLNEAGCRFEETTRTSINAWLSQPSELHRHEVIRHLQTIVSKNDPQYWLLASIVWSDGSIAPPDSAPVHAPIELVWAALNTAFNLVSSLSNPSEFRTALIAEGWKRVAELDLHSSSLDPTGGVS